MKISFLTPSPGTLKQEWYRDLHYQKVGVPNLAGWLMRAGFRDIRHYDFNNQVSRAYAASPGSVRLSLYADDAAVRQCLRSWTGPLASQTLFLLDVLKVRESRLFGISLTYFLGDEREIQLGIRLAQCLARALKERFPGCAVLVGGLQNMDTIVQRGQYRRLLRECRWIDYAVCGDAHQALLMVCRAIETGAEPEGGPQFMTERIAGGRLFYEAEPDNEVPAHPRYFRRLPEGELRDPSVPPGFPAYDPANSRGYAYSAERIREVYGLPEKYLPQLKRRGERDSYLLLQASFNEGCPFRCHFCSEAGSEFFSLSPGEAVGVLKALRRRLGCRHFLLYNPNFNPTPSYAKEMLRAIIKARLDILWADCFNLRNIDQEMISLMRDAGVVKAVSGVEFPTPRMLKYINKGLTVEKADRVLESLHKAGIWNHVLLITGFPTETQKDLEDLESWLRRTSDFVDAYTVGSFHMVQNSAFHRDPGKFGFRLGRNLTLYAQSEFRESGRNWEDKQRLNADSNRRITAFINRLKGTPKLTGTRMEDSHLLMYLYRSLGRERKPLIREIYGSSSTVNPHIGPACAHLKRAAAEPASPLSRLLRHSGATLGGISSSREELEFTLECGGLAARCSLRARSEEILLNSAWNRVHGAQFVLHYDPYTPAVTGSRHLAALAARLGAELLPGRPENCRPDKASFSFRVNLSSSDFTVGLRPRSVSASGSSGTPLPPALRSAVGRLAAAAATRPEPAALRRLAALLPGILGEVEAWDARGPF